MIAEERAVQVLQNEGKESLEVVGVEVRVEVEDEDSDLWVNENREHPVINVSGYNERRTRKKQEQQYKPKPRNLPKKSQAEINGAYSMFARNSADKSRVNICCENEIEFDSNALPGHAKLIIKRSERFDKNYTNHKALQSELNLETADDDNEIAMYIRKSRDIPKSSLADFVNLQSSPKPSVNTAPSPNVWDKSPWAQKASSNQAIENAKSTISFIDECLTSFSKMSIGSPERDEQAQLLDALKPQLEQIQTELMIAMENANESDVTEALNLLEKATMISTAITNK